MIKNKLISPPRPLALLSTKNYVFRKGRNHRDQVTLLISRGRENTYDALIKARMLVKGGL